MEKKNGRPLAEIDKQQFEQLCAYQSTEQEICEWFGVTDKTLVRWCKRTYGKGFSEIFAQKRVKGHISLRRAQFQQAENNPTMAIWLGKQYLGQTDHKEIAVSQTVQQEAIDAVEDFLNAAGTKTETPS